MSLTLNENELELLFPTSEAPEQKPIIVDYINWNGKQALRKVIPTGVYWGSTKFHGEPQWLMTAICCRSGDEKTFALGDCNFDVFRHHNVYFEEDEDELA